MFTPRFIASALLALASVFPSSALAADAPAVTATFSEPMYELGDTIELEITAEPGSWVCILIDTVQGSFTLPGIITMDLERSSSFILRDLGVTPPSGTWSVAVPTSCTDVFLTEQPLFVQVVMFPPANPFPGCVSELQTLIFGNGDCDRCPTDAIADPQATTLPGGMAFHFPGLGGDYVFESQGEFQERKDGTAAVQGVLASISNPSERFIVDMEFSGRLDALDAAFPPVGSPKLKLNSNMYLAGGGPINTGGWHYYTDLTGDLIGIESLSGAYVSLESNGGAAQVGRGASGKNLGFGACAGIRTIVRSQPTTGPSMGGTDSGEMTLDIGSCPQPLENICTSSSEPSGHILWWPEVSKNFLGLTDNVTWEEYADGTAHLYGTVEVLGQPGVCFELDVHLSDRMDSSDPAFPPAGSPKYGNVDPNQVDDSTWHYYLKTEGTLRGCGDWAGAVLRMERMGPAFQVGVGANYHDLDYGGSGWITLHTLQQPDSGVILPATTNGDINLDFIPCPEPSKAADPVAQWDFSEQSGDRVTDLVDGLRLDFAGDDFDWVSNSHGKGLEFEENDGDMLRTSSKSDGAALRAKLQATGEVTVQVFYSQDDDSDNDARLFSWSSDTAITDRNLTMMSYPEGNGFEGELRLKTSSTTSTTEHGFGFSEDEAVVYTMTYDSKEGVVRGYLNGALISTSVQTGDFANWDDHKIRFGNESGGDRSFVGVLYDICIWDEALDATAVGKEADALLHP